MKKLTTFALALLAIAGCTNKEVETVVPATKTITSITATREGNPTKTVLQEDGKTIWWSALDEISLFYGDGEGGARFLKDGDEAELVSSFSGNLEVIIGGQETGTDAAKFWGIYPYRSENAVKGTEARVYLEDKQMAEAGTFDSYTFPSVACSDNLNLAFYNVFGLLAITVADEGVDVIRLESKGQEMFYNTYWADMESGRPLVVGGEGDALTSIELWAPSTDGFDPEAVYYMAVPPMTFEEGVTFSLSYSSGDVKTMDIAGPVTVGRSQVHAVTVKGEAQGVASTTIAEVLENGVGTYDLIENLTVCAVDGKNAIVGDSTGKMLLFMNNHGLAYGDTFKLENAEATVYKGVLELSSGTITKGEQGTVNHGLLYDLDDEATAADLLNEFSAEGYHSAVYVTMSGKLSSDQKITGAYAVLYNAVKYSAFNGKDVVTEGYVYCYSSSYSNYNYLAVSIQEDPSVEKYTITLTQPEIGGSISASASEAAEGETITLTATPASGYALDAWSVSGASGTPIEVSNNSFVMPAENVNVTATFVESTTPVEPTAIAGILKNGAGTYALVEDLTVCAVDGKNAIVGDSTGKMLLFMNNHGLAYGDTFKIENAGATVYNGILELSSGTITKTGQGDVNHGLLYDLDDEETAGDLLNEFSAEGYHSAVYVTMSGAFSSNQKITGAYAVLYNAVKYSAFNGKNVVTEGYVYCYSSSYSNYNYLAVSIQEDSSVEKYTITLTQPEEGGSISASASEAAEGETVTLTATPANGYELDAWSVMYETGAPIEVNNNSFVMPAANVLVTASFKETTITPGTPKVYTLEFTTITKKVNDYTSSWDQTCDGFTWTLTNFNNNNGGWTFVKCGRKNNDSVGTIVTKSVIPEEIATVELNISGITAACVNSIKLYVDTKEDFSSESCQTIVGEIKDGAQTFNIPTRVKNCYYKLEFDCKSASSNGVVWVESVKYTENAWAE